MIDSYKERNGFLCWFLSVFLKKIYLIQFGNDNFKLSIFAHTITFYIQHNSVI